VKLFALRCVHDMLVSRVMYYRFAILRDLIWLFCI